MRLEVERLNLESDQLLSNFAFRFNVRHYTKDGRLSNLMLFQVEYPEDGDKVGRRMFSASIPVLKAPMVSALES